MAVIFINMMCVRVCVRVCVCVCVCVRACVCMFGWLSPGDSSWKQPMGLWVRQDQCSRVKCVLRLFVGPSECPPPIATLSSWWLQQHPHLTASPPIHHHTGRLSLSLCVSHTRLIGVDPPAFSLLTSVLTWTLQRVWDREQCLVVNARLFKSVFVNLFQSHYW